MMWSILVLVMAAAPANRVQAQPPEPQTSACTPTAVRVARMSGDRRLESAELVLVGCDGEPRAEALVEISLLARPARVDRPTAVTDDARSSFVAPEVRRVDPGLLTRLDAIARRFPGHEIQIVSGYRPRARRTSRHRHARALDLRVEGVDREEVVAFSRTLPHTGVGYYPNSTFTHIDVRTTSVHWVDRSAPGQRADYGRWPAGDEDAEDARRSILAEAREALTRLAHPLIPEPLQPAEPAEPSRPAEPLGPAELGAAEPLGPAEPPLTAEELAALRARWRSEISALAGH